MKKWDLPPIKASSSKHSAGPGKGEKSNLADVESHVETSLVSMLEQWVMDLQKLADQETMLWER